MALSGKQKVLIFLKSLEPLAFRKILEQLPAPLVDKINDELSEMGEVSPAEAAMVFQEMSRGVSYVPSAQGKMTSSASNQVEASLSLDPIEKLAKLTPKQLLLLLQDESSQLIAYLISKVNPMVKENYLNLLSPGRRNEIERCVIKQSPLSDDFYPRLAELVLSQNAA
jgi:flagellar motor switch protein FliG